MLGPLLSAAGVHALVLVENGVPRATIVGRAGAGRSLDEAVLRLQRAVETISGARLPVADGLNQVHTTGRVLLGLAGPDPPRLGKDRLGYDGCYVRVRGDELVILGPTDAGVANGVSWFVEWKLGLQILGFGPGDRVVPSQSSIEVEDFEYVHRPSFAWRESWTSAVRGYEGYIPVLDEAERGRSEEYYALNRRGGVPLSGAHSLYRYIPDSLFSSHPEYFPLIDGKRVVESPRGGSVQRELSHPGVLQRVVESLRDRYPPHAVAFATVSPNDDPYWSESEADRHLAEDPGARMMLFCNRIVEALAPTHQGLGACFLAYSYSGTMEPPLGHLAHERVVPLVAPLGACPVHGPADGSCPDHGEMRRIYEGWKQVAAKVAIYPYLYANILPLPTPGVVAEEIRYYHHLGLFGVQREHMARGFGWELSYWLEWQLLWDAEMEVSALRRVFMEGWYGAAAPAMQRIYDRVEGAVASAPPGRTMARRDRVRYWRGWFTGWTDSFNQLPGPLSGTGEANARDLAEARALADTPVARAHVERDAADLTAMAAYGRGRLAFDSWDAGESGPTEALGTIDSALAEVRRLQPTSVRGVHAPLGQLRRLREMVAAGERERDR